MGVIPDEIDKYTLPQSVEAYSRGLICIIGKGYCNKCYLSLSVIESLISNCECALSATQLMSHKRSIRFLGECMCRELMHGRSTSLLAEKCWLQLNFSQSLDANMPLLMRLSLMNSSSA